ncbi:MAG TPA: PKD domain-containing protein [Pyrinomonadaceae bacterium]|nr:PKD domain-containing protein [Pyrinomonadaceae bacterium]HMP66538.1 PKD domain-containing protein [Pyrinomonadaceae bacterium]
MLRYLVFPAIFLSFSLICLGQNDPMGCPKIEVLGPPSVTIPGDVITFTATVSTSRSDIRYEWTVSSGTIEKGQGTPVISVRTSAADAEKTITASVKVDGLLPWCNTGSSDSAVVAGFPGCGRPSDEFGSLEPDDIRARIDAFLIEIANNPNSQGLILFVVEEDEKVNQSNLRLRFIVDHIRFRKFDLGRIIFKFEEGDYISTRLWRVPPAAEMPCQHCFTIYGTEIK